MADGSRGVVVMNRSPQTQAMNLTWDMLRLQPGAEAVVRDLWAKEDIVVARGSFRVVVPPRDAAALRLRLAR